MRKLIVLMAIVCIITMACGKRETTRETETQADEQVDYGITAKDKEDIINVFKAYLEYNKERGDSTMKTMHISGSTEEVLAEYDKNRSHVDSVMQRCIGLTKDGQYGRLYDLLNKERMSIQSSPGNSIENEWDLVLILRILGEKKLANDMETFYKDMLPWDEFCVIHMDALKAMGMGMHPDYVLALMRVAADYEIIEKGQKAFDAWKRVAKTSLEKDDVKNHIASMIHLSSLYKKAGLKESADSCINAVSARPEYMEVKNEMSE